MAASARDIINTIESELDRARLRREASDARHDGYADALFNGWRGKVRRSHHPDLNPAEATAAADPSSGGRTASGPPSGPT